MQKNLYPSPPAKIANTAFAVRLGKIFFALSFIALILSMSVILSFLSVAFIALAGVIAILLTLGFIFVIVPDFGNIFTSAVDLSVNVTQFFVDNWYIFVILTVALSIVSATLLSIDKSDNHKGRRITSIVITVIAILLGIIFATGVL